MPNLDSECPTLVLLFPPSKMFGLILIKIESLGKLLENFNENIIQSLALLRHPNVVNMIKNIINIIGSDGKYSLLTSLRYFIEANHQKTSAYISPSLKDIRERFWMGSNFLSYKEIKKTIKIIEKRKKLRNVWKTQTRLEQGPIVATDTCTGFRNIFRRDVIVVWKESPSSKR